MSEAPYPLDGTSGAQVMPVSDALGGEIRGIDLSRDMGDATFEAIHQAWLRHLVLLFRDQDLSAAGQVAFSRRFGDLDLAPVDEYGRKHTEGFPEILVVSNVVEDGAPIGSLGALESKWHTDMSYDERPPRASCLLSIKIPAKGGNTGFLNMYEAYETLPPALAGRIRGLTLKHDATYNSVGLLREGAVPVTDVTSSPGTSHPIVRTHPETGRKALFLGRRNAAYINGHSVEDSEALLDEIWAHTTRDRFTWHHEWRVGDLLIWDNRCTMHRRDGFDTQSQRIMHRTQIMDDQPPSRGEIP